MPAVGSMVVAFLSTGRCGTQWLASGFAVNHPELAVEHEPIGVSYKPRRYFRGYDDPGAALAERAVRDHLARIAATSRPYVETGWPLYAALPLFAARFPNRLRVVHVTRHPVRCALSHLSHQSYAGSPLRSTISRWGMLGPKDRGVFHPEYSKRWTKLSAYEKCLYFWTELNLYGLEFPRRFPSIPFLRLKSENLLAGDRPAIERLLGFLDLPWTDGWLEHVGNSVDRWHFHTDWEVEPAQVFAHQATLEVAAEFAYDFDRLDMDALRARYTGQLPAARRTSARRLVLRRRPPGSRSPQSGYTTW
jgi:hypothetical protein